MRRSPMDSGLDSLVCPLCEVGSLHSSDRGWMHCESCGVRFIRHMLETFRRISEGALSEILFLPADTYPDSTHDS